MPASASGAQAQRAASLTLDIAFFVNGTVTVTLPNGTPVGSTSGPPTVIPAGSYTLEVVGPGGCSQLPLLYLNGPGVNMNDDMTGGEVTNETYIVNFPPNSTYTWHTDRGVSSAIHTFVTSAAVDSTGSGNTSGASSSSGKSSKPTSEDIVGSAIVPFRGTLSGAVSGAGRLTLSYKGKSVTHLTAGRYRITVTDRSAMNGFLLEKVKHAPVSVTSEAFVGKRSVSVTLTAGRWIVAPHLGRTTYSIVVS